MTTPLKSDTLLAVEDLGIQVGGKHLLRGISFALRAGEALTLVGESGAGKSLLAQAIMGNLPPGLRATGRITLDGIATRADDAAAVALAELEHGREAFVLALKRGQLLAHGVGLVAGRVTQQVEGARA